MSIRSTYSKPAKNSTSPPQVRYCCSQISPLHNSLVSQNSFYAFYSIIEFSPWFILFITRHNFDSSYFHMFCTQHFLLSNYTSFDLSSPMTSTSKALSSAFLALALVSLLARNQMSAKFINCQTPMQVVVMNPLWKFGAWTAGYSSSWDQAIIACPIAFILAVTMALSSASLDISVVAQDMDIGARAKRYWLAFVRARLEQ